MTGHPTWEAPRCGLWRDFSETFFVDPVAVTLLDLGALLLCVKGLA